MNIGSVEKRNKLFDNAKEHAIEKRGMTTAFDDATKNEEKYGRDLLIFCIYIRIDYVIFNLPYFSNDANSLDKGKDTSERSILDGFLGCDDDVSLFPMIVALLK